MSAAPATTTKPLGALMEGDVVLGIGSTMFTEPHTVTEVRRLAREGLPVAIYATGGPSLPVVVAA